MGVIAISWENVRRTNNVISRIAVREVRERER